MIRFLAFVILLAAIAAGVLWLIDPTYLGLPPRQGESVRPAAVSTKNVVAQELDIAAKDHGVPNAIIGGEALFDPIQFSGVLLPSKEQEISAQIERRIVDISVRPGQDVRGLDAKGNKTVIVKLDDSVALQEREARRLDVEKRMPEKIKAAEAEYLVTKSIFERDTKLFLDKAIPKQEWEISQFRAQKAEMEWYAAKAEWEMAKANLVKAERELALHSLSSEIDGKVERVHKKIGETTRVGEPILTVVNNKRLWVEGAIDQQYARFLRPGMRIQVFPEWIQANTRELRGHTQDITGLSVSPDSRLLASSSKDGYVILWDWRTGKRVWDGRTSKPDVDFDSIAFSPVVTAGDSGTVTYHVVAGCSDGNVLQWTLTVRAARSNIPEVMEAKRVDLKEEKGHSSGVTAVAFSPDGQFCATGGEDRQICLWSLKDSRFLYAVRAENNETETAHRGTVTSLQFMPDGHLISAASDRTLRKWKLGEKNAELVGEVGGRTGDVKQITISRDGKLALFDHDEELRVLDLGNFQTLSVLAGHQLGHFRNLACFSPDAEMILTTTTNGRLQLWSTPERPEVQAIYRHAYAQGVRRNNLHIFGLLSAYTGTAPQFCLLSQLWLWTGAPQESQIANDQDTANLNISFPELWNLGGQPFRQLQTPEATTETLGAFAPNAPVLFTCGTDKIIRVWNKPTRQETSEAMEAVITFVGTQIDGGLIRVRAEMDNPTDSKYLLSIGTKVNLRAYPETLRQPTHQQTAGR